MFKAIQIFIFPQMKILQVAKTMQFTWNVEI